MNLAQRVRSLDLRRLRRPVVIVALTLPVLAVVIGTWRNPEFWFTADQQGERLLRRGEFAEAAERFRDPVRGGVAWYRAGEFEKAAAAFLRSTAPEAHYNRGNSLVFLGKYDAAVEAYDKALAKRPDWEAARGNREIALKRAERLKREGGEGTGGKLGADEIVFEPGKKGGDGEQVEVTEEGGEMSDKELQALWLRRIQTKPADFLKAKFSWQAAKDEGGSNE